MVSNVYVNCVKYELPRPIPVKSWYSDTRLHSTEWPSELPDVLSEGPEIVLMEMEDVEGNGIVEKEEGLRKRNFERW